MSSLSGKIALVTGASRGIGRGIALALARQGAKVVVNYASREKDARETAQLIIEANGLEPYLKQFNVSQSREVDEALAAIRRDLGEVDILVNNAGITKDGLLLRCKDEDWRAVFATNLDGAFYCSRACARFMVKRHWGRIINISSVSGERGNAGQVAYASAKAGMIGMTKALARELASRNITVNAITPGFIETDMTTFLSEKNSSEFVKQIPVGFAGSSHDIGYATAFLASEEARYMTGHVLAVNGGLYM